MYQGTNIENYVAQALQANEKSSYYWKSSSSAEVDFIISNDDGVIPVEVIQNQKV